MEQLHNVLRRVAALVGATLLELLAGINRAGDAVAKGFFSTRAVPAAALASQEGQQQQCG